ncbi:geranylgeranylglycerol-phosphate geranylgeranyltransferase [Calditrichota bacterium]
MSFLLKSKIVLILIRPANIFLTLIGTLTGSAIALIETGQPRYGSIISAAFASVLIAAAGFMFNDYIDESSDRINRPHKPLPSGMLGKNHVLTLSLVFFVSGAFIAWIISVPCGVFGILVSLLLVVYSTSLSSKLFSGNLLTAVCASAPFLFGALAAGKIQAGVLAFFLAAPLHLIREIVKDVEDLEGDRAADRQTLPLKIGNTRTLKISGFLMILLALLIPVPYFASWIGLPYLIIAGIFVSIPLSFYGGAVAANPDSIHPKKIQRMLKILMLPGITAIIAGSIYR